MRKLIMLALILFICAGSVIISLQPAYAVGKYTLAYWREAGYNEKGGTGGMHVCDVHIWDEYGNPVSGKEIYTSDGLNYMGTTDSNGCAELAIYESAGGYFLMVKDGSKLSDITPNTCTHRAPDWGHYSFSCGFMYKSDSNNSGTFDLNLYGVLNSEAGQPCSLSAPYTYSLAFCSTKPDMGYYCSDARSGGTSMTSIGQTFVATGNRVVGCQVHVTGSGFSYVARIRDGGPTGAYVGVLATSPSTSDMNYLKTFTKWAKAGVQVTPGQTYFLEITRSGGGNVGAYRVTSDNYSGGCYYEGTTAYTGYELEGSVVCCTVGTPTGFISGNVKTSTGSNLSGATVSTNTGGYSATTDASGNYTIANVAAGTYDVTASKSGYVSQTLTSKTVSSSSTTTANFTVTDASAPTTPSVADDGVYTTNLTQLHATWSASDPESGVTEYSYAIGTSAGASNIVGWVSNGTYSSVTQMVALTPGTKYYLSVKAKNGAGSWSTAGNSDGITAAESMGIADAKTKADGAAVALQGNMISRKGSNCFWIEDSGRTSGIKVNGTTSAVESNKLDVCGVLSTDNGERAINAPDISNITSGTAIKPFGMSSGALSGKPLGDYTPGAEDALGPNNVGLLVTCWGGVVAQASDGFSINDGSRDVKILSGSLVKPVNGMFVTTTGISGLVSDGSDYSPVLRALKQGDIIIIPREGAFGSITGRVTSGGSGVAGAAVSTNTGGYTTNTDGSGYYTLSGVKEGFYNVTASKSGFIGSTQNFVVVAKDATTTCNIALTANVGTISGTVKDGSGSAISGATVSTNTGGYTTTTASDGSYTLSNVVPGTYNVAASKSGYNSSTQTGKSVTANTTTTASFTLTVQTGILSGNVKSGGVNLSGATVSTNTGGYTTTTDASGNYTLSNVAIGTYDVTASKSGYTSSTQTGKSVTANATTTANFTLTSTTTTVYIDTFNGAFVSGGIGNIPTGWTYWGMGSPANTWRETARVLAPNDGTNSSYNVTMQGYCDWQTGSIIIHRSFRPNDWAAPGKTIDWSKPVYIKAEVLGNDRGVGTTWKTWLQLQSYTRTNGETEWGNNGFTNGSWQTTICTLTAGANNGTVTGDLILEVYFDFMGKKFDGFNDLVWENLRMEYTPL